MPDDKKSEEKDAAKAAITKIEGLKLRKEERANARVLQHEALEVEALELEEKYENQGLKFKIDFDIETTAVGNFVVKKPEFLVGKKFADAESKGVEEVIAFVAPSILFPDQMTARGAFQEHAGIAWRLAASLMKLYEADVGVRKGK